MFWIGLIVGVVVTFIATPFMWMAASRKALDVSKNEFWDMTKVMISAAENRECRLEVRADGEILDGMTLAEK